MKKLILLVSFWILGTYIASATHLRAGEITYKLINSLTYEVTLTTYTDVSMGNADDMGANLEFGDGTNADAIRSNGPGNMGEIFNNTTYKKNIYIFNHSYATAGKYTISFTKENRNAGVLNMDQSVQTPFYVETFLIINPFIDFNSSPRLMQPPIDFGGLNKLFVHNPGADDPDGDSLSYELVACRKGVGIEVDNYRLPTPNNGFATQSFTIDSIRGDVIWRNPNTIGLFNIAILITEWRYLPAQNRYIKIGSVVRDMQIEIKDTRNNPPVLQLPNDTCVLAGTFLNTVITATDADSDEITMTATSRIFSLPNPNKGIFNQPSQGIGFVSEPFSWATSCNQVKRQPYTVVFKVVDNGGPDKDVRLVDLRTWRITVVSPPPQNVTAQADGLGFQVNWQALNCNNVTGYMVYRKTGTFSFTPGPCETGAPLQYTLIKTINDKNITNYYDRDNSLSIGNIYCYRIVAFYADGAESIVSQEACDSLKRELPSITRVSIFNTNITAGADTLTWVKPTETDTNTFKPPYSYNIFRTSSTSNTKVLIRNFTSPAFYLLNDTVLIDNNLNTENEQYTYTVEFNANSSTGPVNIGSSKPAASVFLRATGKDSRVELSWAVNVPWQNYMYYVFKKDVNNNYIFLDSTASTTYKDNKLSNGETYCYYIRSFGSYTSNGFPKPLINNSQMECATAIDMEAPCPPKLTLQNNCDEFKNTLNWDFNFILPLENCEADISFFELFKQNQNGQVYAKIATIPANDAGTYEYIDNNNVSIAGKYYVKATDSVGNIGLSSDIVMADNCPILAFPNIFTPNEDAKNDKFMAFPDSVRYIEKVDMRIYNRWGALVYQSSDPKFEWNGTHYLSNEKMYDGVYFYLCTYEDIFFEANKPKVLKGTITIMGAGI